MTMSSEHLNELLQHCLYEKYDENTVLFEFGDDSAKIYIILQGRVIILTPENQYAPMVSEIRKEKAKWLLESKNLMFDKLTVVNFLETGATFGDLGIHFHVDRTATVITESQCHFAIITAKTYLRVFGRDLMQKTNQKVQFLHEIPIFSSWDDANLTILLCHIKEKKLFRNCIIYKEGEISDKFFIVKDGEIEISCEKVNGDINADKNYGTGTELDFFQSHNLKYKASLKQRVVLGFLKEKQYFGADELFTRNARKEKAVVKSAFAILWELHYTNFTDNARSSSSLELMKEFTKEKTLLHKAFITNEKKISKPKSHITPLKYRDTVNLFENFKGTPLEYHYKIELMTKVFERGKVKQDKKMLEKNIEFLSQKKHLNIRKSLPTLKPMPIAQHQSQEFGGIIANLNINKGHKTERFTEEAIPKILSHKSSFIIGFEDSEKKEEKSLIKNSSLNQIIFSPRKTELPSAMKDNPNRWLPQNQSKLKKKSASQKLVAKKYRQLQICLSQLDSNLILLIFAIFFFQNLNNKTPYSCEHLSK